MREISRALVTGGAGFIGSHIVDELIGRGRETVVLDNFSTGSMENLGRHSDSDLLRVFTGEVSDVAQIMGGVENIDVVFHEAAIASVKKSVEDPALVHAVNVDATIDLMNFCVKRQVKRLMFASSAAVYGSLRDVPASEEQLCAPASPYGSSKLAVECYLSSYYKTYGLETVGLRYFNVYGPRQKKNDYSGVITVFANALMQGTAPTIFGDGGQTRDFVFVKDIVQANMLAMTSDRAAGEVFNVASGSSTGVLELFEILRDLLGEGDLRPQYGPERVGDVRFGRASISKIQRVLGYVPTASLRDGLSKLVDGIEASPRILST
jgi:nucleoside-diphosphate-sugar epimerase